MTGPTVRPFLMFEGQAAEAIAFYRSLFADALVSDVEYHATDEGRPPRSIKRATLSIGGQEVLCTDSIVKHDFSFTPAFSFFVECRSKGQVRELAGALAAGGAELMPIGNYGFSRLFAWVNDRFGVSWQLNYA